jgi:hypothetical protein
MLAVAELALALTAIVVPYLAQTAIMGDDVRAFRWPLSLWACGRAYYCRPSE